MHQYISYKPALVIAILLMSACPFSARAGLTIIANPPGRSQGSVTLDQEGNIYGTIFGGQIYEIRKGTNTPITIATVGNVGSGLYSGVTLDANGNLYGTTYRGGVSGVGTVYEIVKGANIATLVAEFSYTSAGTDPSGPIAGVTFDAQGNLWGTTQLGGAYGSGAVYEIVKGSNTITTVASFNLENGAQSFANLTFDAAGNLYGTTTFGGDISASSGFGTVFEIVKGSNTITTLATFDGTNGAYPYFSGVTLDAQGNLYGTTYGGGTSYPRSNFGGTVFEIAKGSNSLTTLASFGGNDGDGTNGLRPLGGVTLDSNGNLFGTTSIGGQYGAGTLFEIVKGSNTITTLASFDGNYAGAPNSAPIFDANGDLYGNTGGDLYGDGVNSVYKYSFTTTAVPEPATLLLAMLGLGAVALFKCKLGHRRF